RGKLPFPQEHPSERMFAILTKEFEPLPSDVPSPLREVISKTLAKTPNERYRSAEAMRTDLQLVLAGISQEMPALTEMLPAPEKPEILTERLPNSIDVPAPASTKLVLTANPVSDQSPVLTAGSDSVLQNLKASENRGFDRATKFLIGTAVGLVFLIAALVGIIFMSKGEAAKTDPQPENTPAAEIPYVTPGDVPSVSPTPDQSPTPTPTPQINGKYSGPTGDAVIKGANEKGFSFGFILYTSRTGRCGEESGKASWTSPGNASFTVIPDLVSYNDANSGFYKEKCKLTFRFSGNKVNVDEKGCLFLHGASCEFAGTYTQTSRK
ncbi:MAG: hypothetical protein ACRD43_06380, partial [Pyrinomonadaceae bacterium]